MFDKFKDMLKGFGSDEYEEDNYDENDISAYDNKSYEKEYYDFDDEDTLSNYESSNFTKSNKKYSGISEDDVTTNAHYKYDDLRFSKKDTSNSKLNANKDARRSFDEYMNSNHGSTKVQVLRPNKDDDWSKICDCLLEGDVIICNFEGIQPAIQHNIMYSLMGACYVMNAKCRYINPNILILVGKDVELDGDLKKVISESTDVNGWEE